MKSQAILCGPSLAIKKIAISIELVPQITASSMRGLPDARFAETSIRDLSFKNKDLQPLIDVAEGQQNLWKSDADHKTSRLSHYSHA